MSDFSPYLAGLIVDWLSQDTAMPTPPDPLYVTAFDDTGTEVAGEFTNARAPVNTPDRFTVTNTVFENSDRIDLGEAGSFVEDITEVALYDAETGGNELARTTLDNGPFNVATGANLFFLAGELSFDVVDTSE